MKRKPLLVLAAMSMLVACGGTGSTNSNGSNVENNSGVSSTDIGSSNIDLGSSLTSSSKKVTYDSTPSTNDHSVDDIYDMIEELSLTNTFHQKIYTADDILSFTYKENEYIAQAGGEFEYSAIRLKDYKKDSNDYRVFLAPWEAQEDGSKSYRIGEAIYLYDYYEMKAVAPETSLLEYSPTFLYDEYKTLYNEILETDKKNVFEMNYKASWGLLGNGIRTFYAYIANLIGGAEYFGASRLRKIEMFFNSEDHLVIVGKINSFEDDDLHDAFVSEFWGAGNAKDEDLERFLSSDAAKISDEAMPEEKGANIIGSSLSTSTTAYSIINGKKEEMGKFELDYTSDRARIKNPNGTYYYHQEDGNMYEDYIDGWNEVSKKSTGFKWSAINGLKDQIDFDDFRKVGENKYRYYGYNFDEIYGDIAETTIPDGFGITDLYIITNGSGVSQVIAESRTYTATLRKTGEEVRLSYQLVTDIVPNRTIAELKPFETYKECDNFRAAFEVLNNKSIEFKVHGTEHAEDEELNNPSDRTVTYAKDYIFDEHTYYRTHGDASGHYEDVKYEEKTGVYLKQENGEVQGTIEFKINKEGNVQAKKALDLTTTKLSWWNSSLTPECFTYDASTRTYTTRPQMGNVSSIYFPKAFKTSQTTFIDCVRVKLNSTLDRVERIEYDNHYVIDGEDLGTATGVLEFTYNIDTQTMRSKLQAMEPFTTPKRWSDSELGDTIVAEFNDYYKGCVDCHGKPFDMDDLPYIYDRIADYYWAPLQMNSMGQFWLLNDGGAADANYMSKIVAMFKNNPDFTYLGKGEYEEDVFENGDMRVRVLPKVTDGLWFSKTNNK